MQSFSANTMIYCRIQINYIFIIYYIFCWHFSHRYYYNGGFILNIFKKKKKTPNVLINNVVNIIKKKKNAIKFQRQMCAYHHQLTRRNVINLWLNNIIIVGNLRVAYSVLVERAREKSVIGVKILFDKLNFMPSELLCRVINSGRRVIRKVFFFFLVNR